MYQMLKSIKSSPKLLTDCLSDDYLKRLDNIATSIVNRDIKRVIFAGCGTSLMLASISEHFFGNWTNMDVYSQSAFELLYYPSIKLKNSDMIIGFSHSGGTKAVVDLVKQHKEKGVYTVGITEVENSRLYDACHDCIVGPGGKDSATPKTRSYLTEMFTVALLACKVGTLQNMDNTSVEKQLFKIPKMIGKTIDESESVVKELVDKMRNYQNYIFVGSGTNYITAKEGSLKMLETANINSTGIQIEELAHGNELYLNKNYTVFFLCPKGCKSQKRLDQIIDATIETEAKTCYISNYDFQEFSGEIISLSSDIDEILSCFIFVIPIQLYAYYSSIQKGINPDVSTGNSDRMKKAIAKYHPKGYH